MSPFEGAAHEPAEKGPSYARALAEAKNDPELGFRMFEGGEIHSSKIDLAKCASFPIPVIKRLEEFMVPECARYLAKEAFTDNFDTDHDKRRVWRNNLRKQPFGDEIADYFKKNNRLAGNSITLLVSSSNIILRAMERSKATLADDGPTQELSRIMNGFQQFGGHAADIYKDSPATQKYEETAKKVSALARELLALTT